MKRFYHHPEAAQNIKTNNVISEQETSDTGKFSETEDNSMSNVI